MMKNPRVSYVSSPTEAISLATARLHLRLDTEADDALVSAMIVAARENAEQYTGLAIVEQTYTLQLDKFPEEELSLDIWPVTGITSIVYVDKDGNNQTLSNSKYALNSYEAPSVVQPLEDWPQTKSIYNAVTVTFTAGFTTGSPNTFPMPSSLTQAMLLMIGNMYENRESVSAFENYERPMSATYLMSPHRISMGL